MDIRPSRPHQPKILFVDDEVSILKALKRFARAQSWDATICESAESALNTPNFSSFDVIVSDMRMPGMTGDRFLAKARERSPHSVRVLLTGYSDIDAIQSAVNEAKIYNYVTKPWDEKNLSQVINSAISKHQDTSEQQKEQENSILKNQKLSKLALLLDKRVKESSMEVDQALSLLECANARAEKYFYDSLNILSQVLEWKEGRDSGHTQFVSEYGEKIAEQLDLSKMEVQNIKISATLHRIGMLCLPDELRIRPLYSFDTDERSLYQRYPIWGELALKASDSLQEVAKTIRYHREAVDGSGFPEGLRGTHIPISSRIIAIASDFYDVYNNRLERSLSGLEDATNYIKKWSGKKYDTEIVEIFFKVLENFGRDNCKKISISTRELAEGMRLDSDIISRNGTLLLTKGANVTQSVIELLKDYEAQCEDKLLINVVVEDITLEALH